MPRVIVALARHGDYHQPAHTPSAHLPHPLTELGREQGAKLGEALVTWARDHGELAIESTVDASSLLRAWETAGLAAAAFGGEVAAFDALAERSVGAAANLNLASIAAAVEADPRYTSLAEGWKRQPDFRLPFIGAETLREAGARVAAHVRSRAADLAASAECDTVKLFVAHGGCIRHAAIELGFLDEAIVQERSMYHGTMVLAERLEGDTWRHVGGEWKIRKPKMPDDS